MKIGISWRPRVGGIVLAALLGATSFNSHASAAIESRNILKTFFETGDVPTQDQFATLIDSYIHQTDDGLTLTAVGAMPSIKYPGGYDALRVGARTGINEMLPYTTLHLGDVIMSVNWTDAGGYLPLTYADSAGLAHYGYLYIVGGSPPSGFAAADPIVIPLYVQNWVWETDANTPIVTAPEPATAGMLLLCGSAALLRRCRRTSRGIAAKS